MADATTFPNHGYYVLQDSNGKPITLARSVSGKATQTFELSAPLKDGTGSLITGMFKMSVITPAPEQKIERIFVKTMNATSTATATVNRGLAPSGIDVDGSGYPTQTSDYALEDIPAGSICAIAWDSFDAESVKKVIIGDLPMTPKITGTLTWDNTAASETAQSVPVYADDTARDAAITSPANGMIIYNTADGVNQQYISGAWADVGNTGTANASETSAGKVELATAAERAAGTATGGTGALLVVTNDALVKTSSGAGDENKLPVLNASGKLATGFMPTNIAEADTFFGSTDITWAEAETLTDGSNADTLHTHNTKELGTNKAGTYFTFQCPSDDNMWSAQNCALIATNYPTIKLDASSTSWFYEIGGFLQPGGYLNFTDEKELELEFFAIFTDADGDISIGTGNRAYTFESVVRGAMLTYDDSANTLYARTGNGTNQESTDVTSGITVTQPNLYRIVHTPESVKYYINGSLVATHTTYINTVSESMGFIACGNLVGMAGFQFTPPIVTIEL